MVWAVIHGHGVVLTKFINALVISTPITGPHLSDKGTVSRTLNNRGSITVRTRRLLFTGRVGSRKSIRRAFMSIRDHGTVSIASLRAPVPRPIATNKPTLLLPFHLPRG